MIDFFPTQHISSSNRRKFGICDRPAPAAEKAYIAERQGQDWIAAVDNYPQVKVNFVPVDHCIELPQGGREYGQPLRRLPVL